MKLTLTYILVLIPVVCLWATKIDKVGLVCIEWSFLTDIYLKPPWSNKKSVYHWLPFASLQAHMLHAEITFTYVCCSEPS